MSLVKKIEDVLPVIARTGKIAFGKNNVLWAIENEPDNIKVILLCRNPPPGLVEEVNERLRKRRLDIRILRSSKTNLELGALCRRPHSVSIVAIYDFGSAPIDEEVLNV